MMNKNKLKDNDFLLFTLTMDQKILLEDNQTKFNFRGYFIELSSNDNVILVRLTDSNKNVYEGHYESDNYTLFLRDLKSEFANNNIDLQWKTNSTLNLATSVLGNRIRFTLYLQKSEKDLIDDLERKIAELENKLHQNLNQSLRGMKSTSELIKIMFDKLELEMAALQKRIENLETKNGV
jgi:polyhydroxyalkanoate synthesis regulator phasin